MGQVCRKVHNNNWYLASLLWNHREYLFKIISNFVNANSRSPASFFFVIVFQRVSIRQSPSMRKMNCKIRACSFNMDNANYIFSAAILENIWSNLSLCTLVSLKRSKMQLTDTSFVEKKRDQGGRILQSDSPWSPNTSETKYSLLTERRDKQLIQDCFFFWINLLFANKMASSQKKKQDFSKKQTGSNGI